MVSNGKNPKFGVQTMVYVRDLHIDQSYQRPLSHGRAQKIADDFDPAIFGELICNKRADGRIFCCDGQHRFNGLMLMGWEDQKVPAILHDGLSVEEEAKLYREYNLYRRRPQPLDLFRARLAEKDSKALAIYVLIKNHGLDIFVSSNGEGMPNNRGHYLNAISTVDDVFEAVGATGLNRTLDVLTQAWGSQHSSVQSMLLDGMGRYVARFGVDSANARLIARLQEVEPHDILAQARSLSALGSGGHRMGAAVAAVMAARYNRGLQGNRLPETTIQQFSQAYRRGANAVLEAPERVATKEKNNGRPSVRPVKRPVSKTVATLEANRRRGR